MVLGLLISSCGKREDYYTCTHSDGSEWNMKVLDKHWVWSYGKHNQVKTRIASEDSEKIVINDEPGDRSIFFKRRSKLLVVMGTDINDTWNCRKLN